MAGSQVMQGSKSAVAHLEAQDGGGVRPVADDRPQHKRGVDGDELEALRLRDGPGGLLRLGLQHQCRINS